MGCDRFNFSAVSTLNHREQGTMETAALEMLRARRAGQSADVAAVLQHGARDAAKIADAIRASPGLEVALERAVDGEGEVRRLGHRRREHGRGHARLRRRRDGRRGPEVHRVPPREEARPRELRRPRPGQGAQARGRDARRRAAARSSSS